MKKEELKEKKLQAEAKLTDEQLERCGTTGASSQGWCAGVGVTGDTGSWKFSAHKEKGQGNAVMEKIRQRL